MKKPVIFLTFANDRNNQFLEALRPEQDNLQTTLIEYSQKNWGNFYPSATSEPHKLLRDLNKYRGQLLIFHFSGHNEGANLQFADQNGKLIPFHKSGLASFLHSEENLQLVFLNACATVEHIKVLQEIGIPAIIATDLSVEDTQAKDFSISFYNCMVAGDTLQEAFFKAKTIISASDTENRIYRTLQWEEDQNEEKTFRWGLHVTELSVLSWRLKDGFPKKKDRFQSSIISSMNELNQKVEKLTKDQYRTLRMIRNLRRVRITGCAGSGKTLVAAEKAMRLANAGIKVLLLCHNPYLADHIKNLVSGTPVEVYDFGAWIYWLNNKKVLSNRANWSILQEPSNEDLETAFENIDQLYLSYGAIIVDEGQDFRTKWWTLLDLLLEDSKEKLFYIFHDDNQALLPHRSNYPIIDPVIDLSRNCRNGGRIFQFMKENFHFSAPSVSEEISGVGEIKICSFGQEDTLNDVLSDAITWMMDTCLIKDFVILLAGSISFSNWEWEKMIIRKPIGLGWQDEVYNKFVEAMGNGKLIKAPGDKTWLVEELSVLSNNQIPTKSDIKEIVKIANSFRLEINSQKPSIPEDIWKERIYWIEVNGRMKLFNRRKGLGLWGFEIILFFQNERWAEGLFEEIEIKFHRGMKRKDTSFPVMKTDQFKGLEADGIILINRGGDYQVREQLYVGVSRARAALAIISDEKRVNFVNSEVKKA